MLESRESGTRKATTRVRGTGKEWEARALLFLRTSQLRRSLARPLAARFARHKWRALNRRLTICSLLLRLSKAVTFAHMIASPNVSIYFFRFAFMFCYRIPLLQFLLSCVPSCASLCFLLPETRDASTLENIDSVKSSATVEMREKGQVR